MNLIVFVVFPLHARELLSEVILHSCFNAQSYLLGLPWFG